MENKFSFETIKNFDEHILASVPNYDVLFNSLVIMSDYFVMNNFTVYDLGCSTGKLINALAEKHKEENLKFIGLDRTWNLMPSETKDARIMFVETNLNEGFGFHDACLVFSIFTLQFLKKDSRASLIKDVYRGLPKGGAFIVTEKVFTDEDSMVQDLFTSCYYDYKKKYFTDKEILDKEVDLRKIMKPLTRTENFDMFREAGFRRVELFYKYFNFEGYLCIK